jgi:hypothetical protein
MKRIALPLRVASRTSSSSVSSATPISRSVGILSSSLVGDAELHRDLAGGRDVGERVHAVAPDRAVAVANMRCSAPQLASSSGSGSTVVMTSPAGSGSRLIIGRPLAVGPPSGRRHTFIR